MIPKIIHFVYGLEENFGGKPFSFVHWAAIKSAIKNNPGYRVIFWHKYLPDNHYFNDVKDQLELGIAEPPDNVFGRPLIHVAHKADIVRLLVLIEYGGIYLDMDTITTASFDGILDNKFVMGVEEANGQKVGLCNAIMASEPKAAFATTWLQTYETFRSQGRDQFWNEHSVQIPSRLAEEMTEDITVLPNKAFFYPDWTRPGLEQMFYEEHQFPDALAHHLWESVSWGALSHFNEHNVQYINNSYTDILRRHIRDDVKALEKSRKAWVEEQFAAKTARLNLGSGSKCDIAAINCDLFPQSGADLVFDLTKDVWPIPDGSAEYVTLHHVMEHLPGDLQHFFKELYRVVKPGGVVDIRVPHPRHDWFLIDPTHCRAWHPESFIFLDRQKCMDWYFAGDARTPLALYWEVDFELIESILFAADQNVADNIGKALGIRVNMEKAVPYLNNIIGEIAVKLRVRKGAGE